MSSSGFLVEAQALFPDAHQVGELVVFSYEIPIGARRGQRIQLGLASPPDWPLSPPPGPHLSPRIGHPGGNVHASPLGDDWEYWSRPIHSWAEGDRTLRRYMGHVRALLEELT